MNLPDAVALEPSYWPAALDGVEAVLRWRPVVDVSTRPCNDPLPKRAALTALPHTHPSSFNVGVKPSRAPQRHFLPKGSGCTA